MNLQKTIKVSCAYCHGTGKEADYSKLPSAMEMCMMIIDGDVMTHNGYRYTNKQCKQCNGQGFSFRIEK